MRLILRRRLIKVSLLVAGLLAGWVASAGANLPPLPTVTLPTVTLPTVTLPPLPPPPPILPPPPPILPPPPPILPPPPPILPPPPPVLPPPPAGPPPSNPGSPGGGSSSGGSGSAGSTSPNGTRAGASTRGSSRQAGSRVAGVYRLRLTRDWISRAGPKKRRQTVLVFVLKRATIVEFVVVQVAPNCRRIGHFRVAGRAGVNRVRFRGRVGRRVLGPGTYRIRARTLPRGRALVETELVVVARPERERIASGRSANTCRSGMPWQSGSSTTPGSGKPSAAVSGARGNADQHAKPSRSDGVLGARFTRKALDAVTRIPPPWLFGLLGLAIALLVAPALPVRATRGWGAAALAHHRETVAFAGVGILIAATVAYALTL